MTVLAIRLANVTNGVSKLHGSVSRKMWKSIWPDLPDAEIPITSITNGIHTPSWVSADVLQLYERYLGVSWMERPADHAIWRRADSIPDAELWRTHERRRERLVAFARRRLKNQLKNRGAPPAEVARADEVLDPDALTIGFARRFATYKRGTLIFRNIERLGAILNDKDRPVQIIFAGKAHPRDHGGKELIAEILHIARRPEFRRRIVFLEDYDINMARMLVQGVDVWLNNPRRPLEASGTSGMKICCNGGLNLSILDGWWVEGYAQDNGWAIGAGEEYTDLTYQDDVESRAIYDLLEQEIVPLFYTRTSDGHPRGWLKMMKRSIASICPYFNTNRMVQEYVEKCYWPSAQRYAMLAADNLKRAAQLAQWRKRLAQGLVGGARRGGGIARGRSDHGRRTARRDGARSARRLGSGRCRSAALPRRCRFIRRHSQSAHGADEPQRQTRGQRHVAFPGDDSVPIEWAAWLCGARAAQARRPGQSFRAGSADVGISRGSRGLRWSAC